MAAVPASSYFRRTLARPRDDEARGNGAPEERAVVCPCQLLGGNASAAVEFTSDFAHSLEDPNDRVLVNSIAATAQALLLGVADVQEFHQELTTEHINVIIKFPPNTCIDFEQFFAIKLINEDRIRKLWVQPDAAYVAMCVSVWRSDIQRPTSVIDVVLLTRRVSAANGDRAQPARLTGKRQRM